MFYDRIVLTDNDILEKAFKVDTKGYRPQEVDKFLDVIIHDYKEFQKILKELELDKKDILDENIRLKQEIRSLKSKLEIMKESDNRDVSSADVLRRLSNLEKTIYGEK